MPKADNSVDRQSQKTDNSIKRETTSASRLSKSPARKGAQSSSKQRFVPTPSIGLQIKTPDTIRMSPRQFLRIGKVQKEHEEPLTEAQVKHRDRSYIISKLNKSI